jgi:hypothetical protein
MHTLLYRTLSPLGELAIIANIIWLSVALRWWMWARHDLRKKNPLAGDLVKIERKIARYSTALSQAQRLR